MCHSSSYSYQLHIKNNIPNRSPYSIRPTANTYWRIVFEVNGAQETFILAYNGNIADSDFMKQVQTRLNPYGITVETITLMINAPQYYNLPSQIVIANQRDFLRALALIPNGDNLYSPLRGVVARVNQDKVADKKEGSDSGYNSEISDN
ncbi:hypothetical protein INT48_007856 [Thamnidium elegans]|uniref:Uncharacterized protein n=1 Tax=Thamnidium elegans TaxID=101142 RepID=A0A8H7SW21_9FUNG|nr:hypothetical protein INT48_007856 [Thamnidium elegans]